jgi:hypothetical protein
MNDDEAKLYERITDVLVQYVKEEGDLSTHSAAMAILGAVKGATSRVPTTEKHT